MKLMTGLFAALLCAPFFVCGAAAQTTATDPQAAAVLNSWADTKAKQEALLKPYLQDKVRAAAAQACLDQLAKVDLAMKNYVRLKTANPPVSQAVLTGAVDNLAKQLQLYRAYLNKFYATGGTAMATSQTLAVSLSRSYQQMSVALANMR